MEDAVMLCKASCDAGRRRDAHLPANQTLEECKAACEPTVGCGLGECPDELAAANTTHADNHSHTDDGGAVTTEADEPVQPAGATAITAVVVAVFGAMAAAMF